jgi:hypothetical protein
MQTFAKSLTFAVYSMGTVTQQNLLPHCSQDRLPGVCNTFLDKPTNHGAD